MDVSYPPVEADFGEQCWKIIPCFGTCFFQNKSLFSHNKSSTNYPRVGPSATVRMNSRPGEVLNLGHNQLEYRGLEILVEVQNAEDGWVL